MRVHHARTHSDRLPNQKCTECGERFYSEHEKSYCSDSCRELGASFEGEANPNYRGGKEATACNICGESFEFYPSEKPGNYCPSCVETEPWRHDPDNSRSANPRWNGGKVELTCANCEATFERYPSETGGEVSLCSNSCRYEWLSKAFAGEGHPNWEGGRNGNYGSGWTRVREKALERDGYRCIVCGTTSEELGRNPDVHHIVPARRFAEHETLARVDAHTLDNLVSLCPSCHRKAEFGNIAASRLRWLNATGTSRASLP